MLSSFSPELYRAATVADMQLWWLIFYAAVSLSVHEAEFLTVESMLILFTY